MGSDMAMNPPPPDPVWQQVRIIQEHRDQLVVAVRELRAEVKELKQQSDRDGQTIARLIREKESAVPSRSLGRNLDDEVVTQCPTCHEYGVACRCA
jgi:uncharacterized coiled-coil DUF342 family protein